MSPPSMTLTLEDGVEGLPTIVDSPAQASFPRDGALLVPGGGGDDACGRTLLLLLHDLISSQSSNRLPYIFRIALFVALVWQLFHICRLHLWILDTKVVREG
jgi:hypothetical protein